MMLAKNLRRYFVAAAAAMGLMGSATPAEAQVVSYESPKDPVLLYKAGNTSTRTVLGNFTGSFTVTASDASIITEFAPEMSGNPGYTLGMLVEPGRDSFGVLDNPAFLSTTPSENYVSVNAYNSNTRSVSVIADNQFQLFVSSGTVGLFPSARILLGGYQNNYDGNGDYTYTSIEAAWVKWVVPSGESVTFEMAMDADFQENCVGVTNCRSSGGVVFGLQTDKGYDSRYMLLTADSRNGSNYSGELTKTYTNTSGSTQVIYGQFNGQANANILSAAVLNSGGTGINADVLQLIAAPVPEPATYALMVTGLLGVGGAVAARRRRDGQDQDNVVSTSTTPRFPAFGSGPGLEKAA